MSYVGQFDLDDINQNSSGSDLKITIGDPKNGSHLGSDKSILFYCIYSSKTLIFSLPLLTRLHHLNVKLDSRFLNCKLTTL